MKRWNILFGLWLCVNYSRIKKDKASCSLCTLNISIRAESIFQKIHTRSNRNNRSCWLWECLNPSLFKVELAKAWDIGKCRWKVGSGNNPLTCTTGHTTSCFDLLCKIRMYKNFRYTSKRTSLERLPTTSSLSWDLYHIHRLHYSHGLFANCLVIRSADSEICHF